MKLARIVLALALFAAASLGFASSLWSWVLHFEPGFHFDQPGASTGPALSSSVTILLIDGLRLDASRRMPALNALRLRGADIEGRVGTPSFSRPGRATLASGAAPQIHGVTTNRQKRAFGLDNLFGRVREVGGTCRVAGSKIWSSLFSADITRCGSYLEGDGKDGPGMFIRQVPQMRASQARSLAFILEQPATLRIADFISTDFAAHEYGGASAEYQEEIMRADAALAELTARIDFRNETLIVTADHGHRDNGGHGGEEPEVLAVPMVLAGAGIRPNSAGQADQADLAPTVAALLGAAIPTGSSGRPILPILLGDQGGPATVEQATALQTRAFNRVVAQRLGVQGSGKGSPDWRESVHDYRDEAMRGRTPLGILLTLLLLASLVVVIRTAPLRAVMTGVAIAVMTLFGPLRPFIPPMSFSAINYDEKLIPFFLGVMGLAAATALLSIGGALLASRFMRKEPPPSASSVAGSVGIVLCTALAGFTLASWLHHGLLLPLALPGPDRLVEAFAITLSLTSVSLTSLLVMTILASVEAARRRVRS